MINGGRIRAMYATGTTRIRRVKLMLSELKILVCLSNHIFLLIKITEAIKGIKLAMENKKIFPFLNYA